RRVARHRLCDHAGLLPGAVAALRLHGIAPADRIADGGRAARRSTTARRRQGAGGYSGTARHHADRSEGGEAVVPHGGEEREKRRVGKAKRAHHCKSIVLGGGHGARAPLPTLRIYGVFSAFSIASCSAILVCCTISSISSSRVTCAAWPVSRPCSASVITPCSAAQTCKACRSRSRPTAGASKDSIRRRNDSRAATCSSESLVAQAMVREANIRR